MERQPPEAGSLSPAGRTEAEPAADALATALAKRRWLLPCVGLGLAGALLLSVLSPPRFVANVTVLPRQSPTSLPWLAGFSGLGLSASLPGESLEGLYGRIVESDRVLDPLVAATWRSAEDTEGRDLFALLRVRCERPVPSTAAVAELKRRLRSRVIAFERDEQTGFMVLRVSVPRHPWLAAALADSLADKLSEFMRDYRAGKAQEQARFVAARVQETEAALRAADDELARFVLANRLYAQSVTLAQEHRRLTREVEALTSIWLELRRQLELARVESNDRKQPLDILDAARVPVERAWPRHVLSAVVGILLGLVAWGCLILTTMAARGLRAATHEALRR